jgi:hypothetical protein
MAREGLRVGPVAGDQTQAATQTQRSIHDWTTGFFDRLQPSDIKTIDAIDQMLDAIRQKRRSKPPLKW